jgi:hypothetical protein
MSMVTIDREAFVKDVQGLFQGTEIYKNLQGVLELQWPEDLIPPKIFSSIGTIATLISSVAASVEIIKLNVIKEQDPDGSKGLKFDMAVALETAVDIVHDTLVFNGWVGFIVNRLDKPLLMLIISVFVEGKPVDWLEEAKQILGFDTKKEIPQVQE